MTKWISTLFVYQIALLQRVRREWTNEERASYALSIVSTLVSGVLYLVSIVILAAAFYFIKLNANFKFQFTKPQILIGLVVLLTAATMAVSPRIKDFFDKNRRHIEQLANETGDINEKRTFWIFLNLFLTMMTPIWVILILVIVATFVLA